MIENLLPQHRSLNILGRFLFVFLFLLSGVTHFTNVPYYLGLMPDSFPFPLFWIYVSGVVELAGAFMILFNRQARMGAWLLVLFLIPVTVVVHGYQMLNAQDEVVRALQQAHFIKGWALVGAALLITQVGVAIKRD